MAMVRLGKGGVRPFAWLVTAGLAVSAIGIAGRLVTLHRELGGAFNKPFGVGLAIGAAWVLAVPALLRAGDQVYADDEDERGAPFPTPRRWHPGAGLAFAFVIAVVGGTLGTIFAFSSGGDERLGVAEMGAALPMLAAGVAFLVSVVLPMLRLERHRVLVLSVHPNPNSGLEAFFIASCDCGWTGEPRDDVDNATDDAFDHDPETDAEVVREDV